MSEKSHRNGKLARALEEQLGVPADKLPEFLEATGLTARQLEKRLLPWRRLKSLFRNVVGFDA